MEVKRKLRSGFQPINIPSKMKFLLCVSSALLIIQATPLQAEVDSFDTPPYTVGNVIGQQGPTSIWTPFGSWASGAGGPIAGNITADGKLQITQTDANPTNGAESISRQYNTASLPATYTIDFDITLVNIDSILAGGFFPGSTNAADYLNVYERATLGGDFSSNGTFLVRGGQFNSTGKLITNGGASNTDKNAYDASAPLNWYVFNYTPLVGHGSFNDLASVVDTGIALAAGNTYHFTITILGGGQWNLKLTNGTTTFDSSISGGPYGFRSNAALPTGNLFFGYNDFGSNTDTAPGLVTMNIDNVAVPEPSVLMLSGLGALAVLVFRRRLAA